MLLREEELKTDAIEAVQHLPSKPEYTREVAILFYLDNMPLKAIAENLGLPLGTVKRKLHEARALLRIAKMKGFCLQVNRFYQVSSALWVVFALF